jgi:hypothetical protein
VSASFADQYQSVAILLQREIAAAFWASGDQSY